MKQAELVPVGASQPGEARGAPGGTPAAARSSRWVQRADEQHNCWAQSCSVCVAVQALAHSAPGSLTWLLCWVAAYAL